MCKRLGYKYIPKTPYFIWDSMGETGVTLTTVYGFMLTICMQGCRCKWQWQPCCRGRAGACWCPRWPSRRRRCWGDPVVKVIKLLFFNITTTAKQTNVFYLASKFRMKRLSLGQNTSLFCSKPVTEKRVFYNPFFHCKKLECLSVQAKVKSQGELITLKKVLGNWHLWSISQNIF